jgi:AraC-like DNA-binding protein
MVPVEPIDRIDPVEPIDRIDPADPTAATDPADARLANDNADPADTADRAEPAEHHDSTDHDDDRDSTDRAIAPNLTQRPPGRRRQWCTDRRLHPLHLHRRPESSPGQRRCRRSVADHLVEPERSHWPRRMAPPHPELRTLVARDYTGYPEGTVEHRLLLPASLSVPVIIKILDSPHRPPEFAMGAHDTYTRVEGACAPSYLELWLAPLGAYTLLGLPMDALANHTVDLVDLLGASGRQLAAGVRDAPTWRERFALVDRFLLRRLGDGPRPAPEVARAWNRLLATGGAGPIGEIAREVGWSHRNLIAKFRQQVGLPPKTAARLVRLDTVWRRLAAPGPHSSWGRIAADAGYADQAHLIRDFRQFTGTTPGRFPVKPVQDAVPAVA